MSLQTAVDVIGRSMRSATAICMPLIFVYVSGAEAASFDCAKASSRIENSVCASAQISKLDDELDTAYRSALSRSTDPAAVRAAQRAWLKQTRNQCPDNECLITVYSERRAALDSSRISALVPSAAVAVATTVTTHNDPTSNTDLTKVAEEAPGAPEGEAARVVAKAAPVPKVRPEAKESSTSIASESEAIGDDKYRQAFVGMFLVLGSLASIACAWFVYRKRMTSGASAVWASVLALASLVGVLLIWTVVLVFTGASRGLFEHESIAELQVRGQYETESVAAAKEKLVGKWVFEKKYAPTCPWIMGSTVYFYLLPNEKSAIQNGLGKVGDYGKWRIAKIYDKSLFAIEQINQSNEIYYRVSELIDASTRTQSIVLHAVPDSKAAAKDALRKTELIAGMEIGSSAMYRCAQTVTESPQSISGEDVVAKMYLQISKGEWGQSEYRQLPQVRSLEMTLLHYMYDNQYEDQRCKNALTDVLREAINDIGRIARMQRNIGFADGQSTAHVHEIASQAQATVQQKGCRWWIL